MTKQAISSVGRRSDHHARGALTLPFEQLPSWPVTGAFVGLPLWWLLGVLDFVWIPISGVMLFYLFRHKSMLVPRGFGLWLLFLLWAGCAAIGLTNAMQFAGFGYRFASYASCTILFVYVFNARTRLTDRFVTGVLTIWWALIVAAGYLALAFPTGSFRTPMSYLLPGSLLSNDWVRRMVVRPLNQYNPESYFELDPRPSAPFIYTNQWGSIYSILLPLVIAYLIHVRGTRKFWLVAAAIPISFVPALMTTNRGMLIGLALAAAYAAIQMMLRRDFRGIIALASIGAVGYLIFLILPVADRLETRAEATSIEDRGWLYLQSIEVVKASPLFGYGRTLTVAGAVDPVGTQGEFWIVLVSYGIGAVALFLGWFVYAFIRTTDWRGPGGLASNTVLLVALLEFFFYGAMPHGLPVIMTAAALALRARFLPMGASPVAPQSTPSRK